MLIDKDAIIKVADIVGADDFYVTKNGQLFEAILGLFERREPIDVVTLANVLDKSKHLESIGGAYLSHRASQNSVPSSACSSVCSHCGHERRPCATIAAASSYQLHGTKENDALDSVLDEAEQALFAVSQNISSKLYTYIKL